MVLIKSGLMANKIEKYSIYSFYRFIELYNISSIKKELEIYFSNKKIRGTILISSEGINGSLSGKSIELVEAVKKIKIVLNIRLLELKISKNKFIPFKKLKIRHKKEIVTLGQGNLEIKKNRGLPVKPGQWDKIVMSNEFKIIDTRNKFEIDIGSFKNSINPNTDSFREFPKKFKKLKIDKDAKLAMFCTGGIRCEKASSFLKKLGYKNVYQLDGGILSYLNYKNKSKITESTWKGDCFVFDDRVTINSKLKKGEYSQCFGCRSAITNQDIASKYYKKGVYCPKCYSIRTDKQKQRSEMRQKQLELNKK